jgi:hypothetical protein
MEIRAGQYLPCFPGLLHSDHTPNQYLDFITPSYLSYRLGCYFPYNPSNDSSRRKRGANFVFPIRSGTHCFFVECCRRLLRNLQRPAIHSSLHWKWQFGGECLSFYSGFNPAHFRPYYFRICDLLLEIMQHRLDGPMRLNRMPRPGISRKPTFFTVHFA